MKLSRSRLPRPRPSGIGRKVAAVGVLAATGATIVVFVSSGGRGAASAETSLQEFVPIQRVAANVVVPKPQGNASTGVFTVDCGTNGNGKFSPDNPVAQPGIKNGAEHVHDFVGNLAITADTSDEALAASDTTCTDGDRSAYFWPVVRIDQNVRAEQADTNAALAGAAATVSCPNVADRLPAVPRSVAGQVRSLLARLDSLTAAANARLAAGKGRIDAGLDNTVLDWLRAQRTATIKQISQVMSWHGRKPVGLVSTVDCDVSYDGLHAGHAAGGAGGVATPTVACPNVKAQLPAIPDQAVDEVNGNLGELDKQIAQANQRLVTAANQGGIGYVDSTILGPLKAARATTLRRIAAAIGRHAAKPGNLGALAACGLAGATSAPTTPATSAPTTAATSAPATPAAPAPSTSAAPLPDPSGPNLELPNNTGTIVRPASVLIEYRGNATGKVVGMPKFLRALTGDAKPTSRGPANARATWTCSGFADRLSDKYPICPAGRQVMRVQDFPGCWDGKNIDSENHRTHVAFADKTTGACPAGFVAIPQLRITISYNIPQEVQEKGQYALDSFPEENHNPFSDHNDFVNVNSERQMNKIAACINTGRRCS